MRSMASEAVRRALEAAAVCLQSPWPKFETRGMKAEQQRARAHELAAAAAIAAFLRALPDYSVMQGLKQPPPPGGTLAHSSLHFIAAAVTRAASEDRG